MLKNGQKKRPEKPKDFYIVPNALPLAPDEFESPTEMLDFWGVHAERFKKGLVQSPIVIEQPKQTYNLSKGEHYFEMENNAKRSIVCNACPIRHGGILEARNLLKYKLENGVLFYKGQAINNAPGKSVIDKSN